MEEENNIIKNDKILDTLFDYSKEEDDILYRNDIFSPLIDEQNKQEKNKKSEIQISRDKILQKLSLEDYNIFPSKNDSTRKEKEEQEQLLEEETEYLKNINKLNYLTFSPFGNNFCPSINKENNNEEKEKEENKLLEILNFDYNNFEVNNDLLFNISMGFIDMNKLKIENVTIKEEQEKKKKRKKSLITLEKIINDENIIKEGKEIDNDDDSEINESQILNKSLIKEIKIFIEENMNINYFNDIIKGFKKELNELKESDNIKQENELLEKWNKIFNEKKKNYTTHSNEEKEKKKKKEEEEKQKKEMEEKLEKERIEKIKKENEFLNELEKIRKKGLQRINRKREMTYYNKNYKNNNLEKTKRIRRKSLEPIEEGYYAKRKKNVNTIENKEKNLKKRYISYDNNDRYTYIKMNKDYNFQNY